MPFWWQPPYKKTLQPEPKWSGNQLECFFPSYSSIAMPIDQRMGLLCPECSSKISVLGENMFDMLSILTIAPNSSSKIAKQRNNPDQIKENKSKRGAIRSDLICFEIAGRQALCFSSRQPVPV